jgi:hypothetical protein
MPHKEFLEEYSLFRKLEADIPKTLDIIGSPPINMFCRYCESEQTFIMTNNLSEFWDYNNVDSRDKKVRFFYECQSCKTFSREFNVYISPELDYIYKYGQFPEWEIKMDKQLEKTLGKHAKTFRKGLVCESQGYGIGAYSYYRRITEEIIDELLESISDIIDEKNKVDYLAALEQTKKTRVTQEKIALVKDLIPSILKPNGINTLGVLHSELSKGLHSEPDNVCLENANHIKSVLIFLINQIIQSKESAKLFTESMKSLLRKRRINNFSHQRTEVKNNSFLL